MKEFPTHVFGLIDPSLYNLLLRTIRESNGLATDMDINGKNVEATGFATKETDDEQWKAIYNLLNGVFKIDCDYVADAWSQSPHDGCFYVPDTDEEQWREWAIHAKLKPIPFSDEDFTHFFDKVGHAVSEASTIILDNSKKLSDELSRTHFQDEQFAKDMQKVAIQAMLKMMGDNLLG